MVVLPSSSGRPGPTPGAAGGQLTDCPATAFSSSAGREETRPNPYYFGGWHEVRDASFGIDSYEFVWREGMGDSPMLGGGQEKHIAGGFTFSKGGHVLSGPPTSVLAIKTQR